MTLTRVRVRITQEADGRQHVYNADTWQRLAIAATREEAEAHAAERGWYVVNPRLREAA